MPHPPATTKRCFIALVPDEVVVADLVEAARPLRQVDGLKLSPAENLHVTLKFLGDVDDAQQDDVIAAIRLALEGAAPFPIDIHELVYLPDPHKARTVAAAVEGPPMLGLLNEKLEDAMELAGFPREGRAFRPHITLGRFKHPPHRGVPRIELPATGCLIDRLTLMASDLRPTGPIYTILAEFPLG
jgi:2'-5' RNA ligase